MTTFCIASEFRSFGSAIRIGAAVSRLFLVNQTGRVVMRSRFVIFSMTFAIERALHAHISVHFERGAAVETLETTFVHYLGTAGALEWHAFSGVHALRAHHTPLGIAAKLGRGCVRVAVGAAARLLVDKTRCVVMRRRLMIFGVALAIERAVDANIGVHFQRRTAVRAL